jgi:hypothetical protein
MPCAPKPLGTECRLDMRPLLAAISSWLLASLAWAQAPAAPSFRSPFHPDECVPAILEAERQLGMSPGALRWERILAQGFLCLGLKDDPAALDRAAAIFRAVLAKAPKDIQAQLGLADALRKRAPLSPEALAELNRAKQFCRSSVVTLQKTSSP